MRLAIRGSHGQPDVVVGHDEEDIGAFVHGMDALHLRIAGKHLGEIDR